jgi:predicted phage baseplate assembly protein
MSGADRQPDTCHCCEGIRSLTPAEHPNRPGLPVLTYRVGTHGSFKATMLAQLSRLPALGTLSTRADDDPTIALIDAWATVADVLSFYIARTANEGFVRTATEARSIQALARSIGYEPHPGVAASTYLAFTVEDSPGAAEEVPIPAGTRAQSSPNGDELPQTFETTEELIAHPEWNALRPRQTEPQLINAATRVFYVEGTDSRLKAGDWMLLRAGENTDPLNPGAVRNVALQVVSVDPDQERQHTRVELVQPQAPPTPFVPPIVIVIFNPPPPSIYVGPMVLSGTNAAALASEFTWSSDDAQLFAEMQFLPETTFAKYINKAVTPKPATDMGVFAMRAQTAPFGHNAPRWDTLPREWRLLPPDPLPTASVPFGNNWDQASPQWPVNAASSGISHFYKGIYGHADQENEIILLDAEFPEILPGSWVLLRSARIDGRLATFRVTRSEQVSRADFALNAQVSALTLEEAEDEPSGLEGFHLRTTTIYAQSEALKLAGKPIDTAVQGDTIELDHMVEHQIRPGQPVIVSGTPTDVEDIIENELAIVSEAVHVAGHTRLIFEKKLQRAYRRQSVTLHANLAPATHGESHEEVLGSGDASQPFQAFRVSHAPLTYVTAPAASGAQSSLELRVNGVLWKEAASVLGLGPDDRRYVLRRDDEGKTTVVFGDGRSGGRLPTGFGNVSASYRSGLGVAGNLAADTITLLGSQPRFVRAVTNPRPAMGGADPEPSADTQRNAPDSVRTFGRIVSLPDFEDFARSFGGVSKAQASLLHIGEAHMVHVTIAGEDGALVSSDSAVYRDLVSAMDAVRDRVQRLLVASYERRFFDVTAKVRVHEDYRADAVLEDVEESLRETFSFARRDLAQGVNLSEVVATMQRIEGVEAIDLDLLRFSHERGLQVVKKVLPSQKGLSKAPTRLPALRARRTATGTVLPAQHLSVHRIELVQMP